MTPLRVDRSRIRDRLAADVPGWIVEELIDAFEPAFLAGLKVAADRRPKPADTKGAGS